MAFLPILLEFTETCFNKSRGSKKNEALENCGGKANTSIQVISLFFPVSFLRLCPVLKRKLILSHGKRSVQQNSLSYLKK